MLVPLLVSVSTRPVRIYSSGNAELKMFFFLVVDHLVPQNGTNGLVSSVLRLLGKTFQAHLFI